MISIRRSILAVIIFVAIFGGIAISSTLGFWKTQSTKSPTKIKSGEFAGMPDPGDIRGSNTFIDIENAFEIPATVLCEVFSFEDMQIKPEDKVNVLETLFAEKVTSKEIGTDSIRLFVAFAKGMPYTPEDETGLPPAAIRYLMINKFMTADTASLYRVAELETQNSAMTVSTSLEDQSTLEQSGSTASVEQTGTKTTQNTAGTPSISAEHTTSEKTVTGTTTFANVISWGVTQEEIEAIVGFSIEQKSAIIKDAVTAQGKSFGTIKTALQELINKKNQ